MRKTLLISGLVVMVSSIAPAFANPTMDVLQSGHKLVVTYPSGDSLSVDFKADGNFETNDGRSGKWTIQENNLCQFVADGTEGCTTLSPDKNVGDTWQMNDIFGNPFTASIE